MKAKYRLGAYLKTPAGVLRVIGVHLNSYTDDNENLDSVQYEFDGEEDWVDEEEIEYELVRKK